MKTEAQKYTYNNPKFITSPSQDYSVSPEIYRRYINYIIGFYVFFFLLFGAGLNFMIDQCFSFFFERSFSIYKVLTYFLGNEDSENKILYATTLIIFFSIIFFPIKKIVFNLTKPTCRVQIEEGLILIRGSNVFEELEQAFEEMNEQQ